jgi:hypothetical protein
VDLSGTARMKLAGPVEHGAKELDLRRHVAHDDARCH